MRILTPLLFTCAFFFAASGTVVAQQDSTEDTIAEEEKMAKETKKANEYFEAKEYFKAAEVYKGAFSKAKGRDEKTVITFNLAECYRNMLDYKMAAAQYEKAMKLGYKDPIAQYWYAEMLKSQGNYEEALLAFEEYKKLNPGDRRAEIGIQSCKQAAEWMNSPVQYEVENLKDLNTRDREMAVTFTARRGQFDEIMFVSSREGSVGKKEDGWTGEGFMDIWEVKAERKKNARRSRGRRGASAGEEKLTWGTPVPLDESVNSKDHEGPLVFDSRRKEMYFTRCIDLKRQKLGCGIWVTQKMGQSWQEPKAVVLTEDSTQSVGHPALSLDDKILYFAGDVDGTRGGKDIFMTTYDRRRDEWNTPVNLGPSVNTELDELFPFVHDDGYLYFASNGLPGMGGLDVFRIKLGEDGMPEGEAENMRYPINTEFEDFAIVFEDGGAKHGYMTSNRKGGRGSDDIYEVTYIPLKFTLEGIVTSKKDGKPIPQVTVRLDGSDGTSVVVNTDKDGRYVFEKEQLNENTTYKLNFEKKKFLNATGDVTTIGVTINQAERTDEGFYLHTLKLNRSMDPIEVPIVLPNVFFDLAKWDLRPESRVALDSVVAILNNNPNIVIELRSHTDYRDTDEKNLVLSQHRADTCVSYIISKGIAADRLVARGMGETEPFSIPENYKGLGSDLFSAGTRLTETFIKGLGLGTDKFEVANQINRRTDFKVLRDDYVPNQKPAEPGKPGTTAAAGAGQKAPAKPAAGEIHICQRGDSFGKIAKQYGINMRDLKDLNGGLRGVQVFDGLELKVTKGGDYSDYDESRYRVEFTDRTFKQIATKLGMDEKDLKELNKDIKERELRAGMILFIK